MTMITRDKALEVVVQMLAAETSCEPENWLDDQVHISTLQPDRFQLPHHRRFPVQEPNLLITTIGTGGVVAASPGWIGWVEQLFASLRRDDLLTLAVLNQAGARVDDIDLNGPTPHFVGSSETVRKPDQPNEYQIRMFMDGDLPLLDSDAWPHAVFDRPDPQRPEMMAAVAYHDEDVIGVATAVADSDTMWQIGIDVANVHTGQGLGTNLTATVARAALEAGIVPYYTTSPANIPSIRTALSAGLWPCWVQVSCAWY